MNFEAKNKLDADERQALIHKLLVILDRLDDAGEALAAIHIDMALNMLDPSRSAKSQRPPED